jgi:anthranilate/para-aminobenzoate synthase component II
MAVKEDARLKDVFDIFSKTKYVQAIKHKTKPFYGVLFHPEVRNKGLIEKFLCS